MWSDPDGNYYIDWDTEIDGWNASPRGAGFIFGGDIVTEFNRRNNIELICRAH